MSGEYPEPPTTDWADLALLSEAEDPEDFRDLWGIVTDEENWKRIQRMLLVEGDYEDRPEEAPFDGAKFHATDINVVFSWDEDGGEWTPLNTGTEEDPVPGTSHFETLTTEELNSTLWTTLGDGIDTANKDIASLENGGQANVYGQQTEDKSLTVSKDNIDLSGSGPETMVEHPADAESVFIILVEGEEDNRVEYVTVSNIRAEAADGSELTEGIELDEADKCSVAGVLSGKNDGHKNADGIDLDNNRHCLVFGSHTYENGQDGVHVSFNTQDNTVLGNFSHADGRHPDTQPGGFGVRDDDTERNLFLANVSTDSGNNAFRQYAGATDNQFGFNRAINPSGYGIRIDDPGAQVVGHLVDSPGKDGVHVDADDVTLSHISILDGDGRGVFFQSGLATASHIVARGNAKEGVRTSSAAGGSRITHVTVETDDDGVRVAGDGMRLDNAYAVSATQGTGSGIHIGPGDGSVIRDVESVGFWRGVDIRGANDVVVEGVKTTNCTNGVKIEDDCSNIRLSNLEFFDCDTDIDDDGTRTLINGRGNNEGDPSSTGEWNAHADYAEDYDATIYDTANDDLYKAVGGSWVQIN